MLIKLSSFFFLMGLSATSMSDSQMRLTISNAPEHIARHIFVGPSHEMPVGDQFYFAIQPTSSVGDLWIPSTLSEAFVELEKSLPRWYQAALMTSRGDFECLVSVNNVDLNIVTMNWIWINWRLGEPKSKLRQALEDMGAEHQEQVLFGIHDGFCFYLKYGEDKALELLTSPSEEWEERELPPLEPEQDRDTYQIDCPSRGKAGT